MQPSEALSTAAQVAVALAGFAGIIVAFRTGSVHEWDAVDKFRLRLLLTNSAYALTFSLFAILLLSVDPAPPWRWRACSLLALALTIPFAARTGKTANALTQYRAGGARMMYYLFATLGTAALLLQIANLFLNVFWLFFATIFVHLIAATFQFVRMIVFNYDRSDAA
jgi:hypothetical protein